MKHVVLLLLLFCTTVFCKRSCNTRPERPGQKLITYYRPFARIGRTINLNKEQLGPRIISNRILKSHTTEEIINSTETNYKVIKTDEDAKRMLDISGKLSLQLQLGTGGNVAAQGAGGYLQNMGDRSTYAELLLIASTTKRYQVLKKEGRYLTRHKCRRLNRIGDTHVITGFEYGGQCIISVRVEIENNEQKTELEGELSGSLNVTRIKGKLQGNFTHILKELTKLHNITIKTYCNANFETVPTNINEAMEVSQNALKILNMQNRDGVPVRMELTPLTHYENCCNVSKYRSATYNDIYLESCSAMMSDARYGLKRLQQCVDNFKLNSEGNQVKKLVMKALSDMRKADYDMNVNIREITGASDIHEFKDFEKLYSSQPIWNYRYWTEYAIALCNSMISYTVPTIKINLKLSPVPKYAYWIETNIKRSLKGLSSYITRRIPSTNYKCHKIASNLLMLIKENVTIHRIEMLIPKETLYLSGTKIYISSNKTAFIKEDHPSFRFIMEIDDENTRIESSKYIDIRNATMKIPPENQSGIVVIKIQLRGLNRVEVCKVEAIGNNYRWFTEKLPRND